MIIRKILLIGILFLLTNRLIAQNDGDFRSFQTGNWSDVTTWERYDSGTTTWEQAGVGNNNPGQLPANTSAVTILGVHTVTIDADADCNDLTIAGTLQGTANTLNVYGNLTNNGTFDLWNTTGTALVFAGTGNVSFSGTGATTDISTIEISKSIITETVTLSPTNFTVQGVAVNAPKFLELTTGTFRISGTFNMTSETFTGGATYNFANDEGFWLDNPNFTVIGQDGQMEFRGLFQISAGVFNVGNTSDQRFYLNNNDIKFVMSGGTLNLTGAFYADDQADINISGGTINVATMQVTTNYWYCFRVNNANSHFTMSSGTINLVNTNQGDQEYYVGTSEANTNITGGTLNVGTATTAGDFDFEIGGRMPNTVVHSNATAIAAHDVFIYDDLLINGDFRYNGSDWRNVTIYGDMNITAGSGFRVYQSPTSTIRQRLYIYGSIIDDGVLIGYWNSGGNESRLYAYFMGATDETITGTGVTCIFYDIRVNKGSDMTATLEVLREISLDAGDATDNNRLYVENGTFKLSSASTLTPYYGNQWINSTTGRFWMNNAGATINWSNAGNSQSRGEFIMDAGTYNAGNNFLIDGASTANNQINGGDIDCPGEFDMEQDVMMTGGNVSAGTYFYVDANGADEYGDLAMTNGTISAKQRLYISGKLEIDAGTITIGGGNNNDIMQIYGGGTLQLDGGDITIDGYTLINEDATANCQINGGTLTVSRYFDMEQDLLMTNGVLTVSGDNTNNYFLIDADGAGEDGDFTVTGGTINVGNGDDRFFLTDNGTFTFSNATLNIYGRFYTDEGDATTTTAVTITSGNINLDPQRSDVGGADCPREDVFRIHNYCDFTFTGGTLTFIDPNANQVNWYDSDMEFLGLNGTRNLIGSTIVFGNGTSTSNGVANHDFTIRCRDRNIDFGDIIINNPTAVADNRVVRVYDQNISIRNLTITAGVFDFNGRNGNIGKQIIIYEDVVNNGEINAIDANPTDGYCHLIFAGSSAQSYSGTGSVAATLPELTFNNTSVTGVTLLADIGATLVNLTDGHVYSSATPNGLLTVFGTATTDLVGGANTNYVQGPLRRAIPNNAVASDYDFPVGKTNYRMFEMIGLRTSGSGDGFITAEFFAVTPEVATGGSGMTDPLDAIDIHWKINNDLSAVNIDHVASVRLTYPVPAPPPVYTVAQSNTGLHGTYDAIGRIVAASTIQSEEYKNAAFTTNAETYLCIGAVEPLEGTYTVGNSGDYLNLTEVAAELRIKYVNDHVIFEMLSNYNDATETFPVDFDVLMLTEPQYDVTIRPQAGVSGTVTALDGAGNGAEIYINHIHDLIFDGRPGGVGAGDWLFEHQDASPTPVFTFKNNTHDNTISYLQIKSDIQTTTSGIVIFNADAGNGNDDITISHCDISGRLSTPTNAIYSVGGVGSENDNNTVDNCNIFDFFNATEDCSGIYLGANNSDWTISNNRIYQTGARVFTEEQTYFAISINSGENYTIDNNIIGYADNSGTGFTDVSGSTSLFRGIYMNVANGVVSNITNNTISGIKFSSANTANFFVPIHVYRGDVNVGAAGNGNTIGTSGAFGVYPVQVTYNANQSNFFGIYTESPRPTRIIDNNIGGIQILGDFRQEVWGIRTNNNNANSDYVISGNTIGSTTQTNSIALGQAGYTNYELFFGIQNYRADNVIISNNTIRNITSFSTGNDGNNRLCGIYHDYDIALIENNTIADFTSYSGNQSDYYYASIIGIVKRSNIENQIIRGNEIFNFNNLNPNNRAVSVFGMDLSGNSNSKDVVSSNFIHNFGSSSNNAEHKGIRLDDGTYNIINNMISLGIDGDGNSVTNPIRIFGIDYRNDDPVDFYHNSIYIGGTGVTSQAGRDSYCINKLDTELSRMWNNIFVNERSNSAGVVSKHYAVYLSYEDVVNADYNIYYISGLGGMLANLDGTDFSTLRATKAYANNGNDHHSGFGSPNFSNPTGNSTNCNLHLTGATPAEGMGSLIAGITTDIDNEDRSTLTPVDIGADAGNFTFDATVDIYVPNFEYVPIEPQACGVTSVTIDVTITDQGTGVPVAGANMPRVYYRDNSGAWAACTNLAGVLQSGDGNDGVWRFTLNGLTNNNFYEYYFVAEDQANNVFSAISNGAATTNNVNIGYSKYDDDSPIHSDVNNVGTYPDSDVEIDVFTVCVYPAATYTVGNDAGCVASLGHVCDFETLTAYGDFFFNMNAMTIDKNVTCYVVADTDEPADFPANQTIEQPVNSNYIIRIEPYDASLKTLNADVSVNKKLIRFEGADNYIVSGQFSGDANRWLEFSHDKDDQSVFYFKDDAQDITVEYLTIKGSGALDPRGTIFFDSTTVASPQGNTDIVIDHNQIFAHTQVPLNAIYSYGGGGADNSNIEITNNEIDAFQNIAIWLTASNNDNWTISNNTIYNTFVGDTLESVISINDGSNYTIDGNNIGGSDATLGGTPMTSTEQTVFNVIYLNCSDAVTSNITNNTIKNIACTYNNWGNNLRGIRVENGKANITGNTLENFSNTRNNNTLGISYDGTSGISISNNTITDFSTSGRGDFYGIYVGTDADNVNQVQNNTIDNITTTNNGNGTDFYGIYNDDGNCSITGNTIGGNNAGDKITFGGSNRFWGIYIHADDVANQAISNNQVLNIEITDCNDFVGIYPHDLADDVVINLNNNTVDNLDLQANNLAVCIYANDGEMNVDNNTVGTAAHGIANSGTAELYGIWLSTNEQNAIIQNNTITNFNNSSNDITAIFADENRTYTISNNTISGHTITNEIAFNGIRITNGNTASIQGNNIEDITMTNAGNNTVFNGIWVPNANVNIGTTSANTIGHATNANSISIAGGIARGMYFSNVTRTITASDNLIANITSTGNSAKIHGVAVENTGGTVNLSGNTIRDLNANGTGATSYVAGIYIDGTNVKNITSNTIRDISTASTKTNISDGILASQGIFVSGTSDADISENTIYNISGDGTANINVAGISENAINAQITKNQIYNLSNTTSGSGTVSGIVLLNLNAGFVANNMISIGNNDAMEYSGVWLPQNNTNTKHIYYNSIYIGGTATGGNSYGFLRGNNTTPLYVRNNIFSNFRTGGAGKHYSIGTKNTTWNATYMQANGYYSATASTTGYWNGVDNDFETLLTNVGETGTYLSTDQMPEFTDAPNCDLHINDANSCGFNSVGEVIASVTDDFDGNARDANFPDIGADEFTPTARSGKYVWRGHSSTDWDVNGNWQCEFRPNDNPGEIIIVPDVANDPVIARALPASTVLADNLDIRQNGILTVAPGNSLTLSGNFTLNGTIVIETPNSETGAAGSFIDNGNISGSGQMIAKRFVNGGQYHEVSSPIVQGTGNNTSAIFTRSNPSGNFNPNLYQYHEYIDLDGNINTEPVGAFDNNNLVPGWYEFHNGDVGADINLVENQGYMFYTDMYQILQFEGVPATGDFDVTGLSFTNNDPDDDGETAPNLYDGWHLLGNPYASSIDWDLIRDDQISGVDDGIYVWDNNGYSGYKNGSSVQLGNLTHLIPPMQGFFVHTNGGATPPAPGGQNFVGSVEIRNEHRAHDAPSYLKNKEYDHSNYLRLQTSANGHDDFIVVQFLPDATNEYDGDYDLVRMFVNPNWGDATLPQLYSITENERDPLALNVLPLDEMHGKTVPLGLSIGNGGNYAISAVELNDFDNIHVYLVDSLENNIVNLRTNQSYDFDFDGGRIDDRFYLNFSGNNAPELTNQIENQQTDEDAEFSFTFAENTFVDSDFGDILRYEASIVSKTQLPEWLSFDSDTRTFSGIPLNENVGEINLQIVAFDMFNETDTVYFALKVVNTNDAPTVANNIPDMETNVGELFTYQIPENTFADIDFGDNLTLSAQLDGGFILPYWLKFNSLTNTLSGIPENAGAIDIEIIATDIAGEKVSDIFTLTIKETTNIVDVSDVKIEIYPNPTQDIANIYLEHGFDEVRSVEITDILGKTIRIINPVKNQNNIEIDLTNFAGGTYIVAIKFNDNSIIYETIIKE